MGALVELGLEPKLLLSDAPPLPPVPSAAAQVGDSVTVGWLVDGLNR